MCTRAVPRPGRIMIQPSLMAAVDRAKVELAAASAMASEGGAEKASVILLTGSMHIAGAALRQLPLEPAV